MKKTVWSLMLLSIISCSSPTQNELLQYINTEIPKIATMESEVMDIYNNVTGENYKDDETLSNKLSDDVIPKYKKFVEALENISENLKEPEIIKINEIYIEAANAHFSAFVVLLAGLENQDLALVNQANEKLAMGRKLIRQYQLDLKTLAKSNNIEFKK